MAINIMTDITINGTKINIYKGQTGYWRYVCSTKQSKTLKDAKRIFLIAHPEIYPDCIKCYFDKG